MQLTERQRTVLKTVVEEFVVTALPVPSEKVAGRPGLSVSSATIRNEMVELEEFGLLTHPHTSAGRMPSDVGYRYYLEHLMRESAVGEAEQHTAWHQFHQVEPEVDEWVPLAAAVLAQMARMTALVTRLHSRDSRFKRLELVPIEEDLVLVVLILQSGSVEQRMLRLEERAERHELVALANRLGVALDNATSAQVGRRAERMVGREREIALLVARLMEQTERNWSNDICFDGISFSSVEPEFGRIERLMELVEALRRGFPLAPMLSDVLSSGDLRVVIGRENESEQMRGCSVVLQRYGGSSHAAGVVGLVGPTRMRYWRAVALVRFMADLLDRLAEESMRQRR